MQLSLGWLRLPRLLAEEALELRCSVPELASGAASCAIVAAYARGKHWLANNALGLAFSLTGIEQLSLGSVKTGTLLLCGLFVYDVFWVFCTPVMVSVAKNFDAPIKLLFPRAAQPTAAAAAAAAAALLNASADDAAGPASPKKRPFNMLGLGDIVIPGVFLALVLHMDVARRKAAAGGAPPREYFAGACVGYVAGLAATIGVMTAFNAAQPALLYIVPAVLAAVLARAAAAGEFAEVFAWSEEAEPTEEEKAAAAKAAAEPWWQPLAALLGVGSGKEKAE